MERRRLRRCAFVVALVVVVLFAADAQAAPGDLDLTFSGDGKQTTDFGFGLSNAAAVVLQPDGKIVAVGTDPARGFEGSSPSPATTPTGRSTPASPATASRGPISGASTRRPAWRSSPTARSSPSAPTAATSPSPATTPTGPRPGFSGDGRQTADFSFELGEQANEVLLQDDGRIVAVGGASEGATGGALFALARHNPNGSLDTSFSGNGTQTTDFGPGGGASGAALRGDGRIVAVGVGQGPNQTDDFALARYLGG